MHLVDKAVEKAQIVASDVLASRAEETDREARWPAKGIRALLDAGLGGLVAPADAGGWGLGLEALARVCEALGVHCASTSLCFGMHCVATAVIGAKATATQTSDYLVDIAAGRHVAGLALSEPGTGSHFYLPQTQVRRRGDRLVLDGSKSFVTSGGHADSYVVSVVADDGVAGLGKFSCLLVDADAEGLIWGPPWRGLGMRGNASRNLELRGVEVPADHLLGEEGDQIWYVFEVVAPYFLVAMAGTYLGIGSAALNRARRHLASREQSHSSEPLGHVSVLQHRLGKLWGRLEAARRLVYHAGAASDGGREDSLHAVLAAKAEVADVVTETVNEVLTLLGGSGYQEGDAMSRHLRDARAAHVMSPTTDLLRTWLGRSLLDLPILME